jgi:hypothetical protein
MISVVAHSSPAQADALATREEEAITCMTNSHVPSVEEEEEEWDGFDVPVIPIGSTAPVDVAPVVPKVEKPAKEIKKKQCSMEELVVRIVAIFKKDYFRFSNSGIDFYNGTSFNLYDKKMEDPTYGPLGFALQQAFTYYGRSYKSRESLSKIKQDISDLESRIRVAICKKQAGEQIKLCGKLDERRGDLTKALAEIEFAKKSYTPFLDDVRAAIEILKRENDKSYKFCRMFTQYNKTESFEKEVEEVVVVPDVVVVVTKKAKPVQPQSSPVAFNYATSGSSSWWDDEPVPSVAAAPKETVDAPVEAPVKAQVVAPVAAAPVVAASKKSVFGKKKLNLM